MPKLQLDVQPKDREWMVTHTTDIDHLADLVIEMFEKDPKTLLSPVFRRLIVDHAHKVKVQRKLLAGRELFIDNPGKPIGER